jgi:hypothetical protein
VPEARPPAAIRLTRAFFRTNMVRLYGRGPRGERVIDELPQRAPLTKRCLGSIRDVAIEAGLFNAT